MSPTVTLTWFELSMAASVGVRRKIESLRRGRENRHGFKGTGWDVDVQGAAAEMAVAKLLGIYWDGSVDAFHRGDVGRLQVRMTLHERGHLMVRPADADRDTFLLLTGIAPTFTYRGWITGAGAKRPEWLQAPADRPPVYMVPQESLNPDNPFGFPLLQETPGERGPDPEHQPA